MNKKTIRNCANREAQRADRAILPHLRHLYNRVPLNQGLHPRL